MAPKKKSAREIVVEACEQQLMVGGEECTPGADLRTDLGADSLDFVELSMIFEEELDITISDEDMEGVKTVQNLTDLIARKAKLDGVSSEAAAS